MTMILIFYFDSDFVIDSCWFFSVAVTYQNSVCYITALSLPLCVNDITKK